MASPYSFFHRFFSVPSPFTVISMFDYIPFEIQSEIIKYLPLKSLLQFRTVSNKWKSFIDSPNFIADYTFDNPNQPSHHLLIGNDPISSQSTFISIADDDNFPLNKHSITLPPFVNLVDDSILVGSSHGLICLCSYYKSRYDFVLWNPSIRKSIPIPLATLDLLRLKAFGFGVCPVTNVPKLVLISITGKTEVFSFSLNSGDWRISPANPPNKWVGLLWSLSPVTIDRFVYWHGIESNGNLLHFERNAVISFDLSSEEFEEIHLPGNLAYSMHFELFKRSDSLAVVVKQHRQHNTRVYEVWGMENGVSNAFAKLFTVIHPESPYMESFPIGFNRNGEVLILINGPRSKVVVYKPLVEWVEDVWTEVGVPSSLMVCSYTKSLLLLNL